MDNKNSEKEVYSHITICIPQFLYVYIAIDV